MRKCEIMILVVTKFCEALKQKEIWYTPITARKPGTTHTYYKQAAEANQWQGSHRNLGIHCHLPPHLLLPKQHVEYASFSIFPNEVCLGTPCRVPKAQTIALSVMSPKLQQLQISDSENDVKHTAKFKKIKSDGPSVSCQTSRWLDGFLWDAPQTRTFL